MTVHVHLPAIESSVVVTTLSDSSIFGQFKGHFLIETVFRPCNCVAKGVADSSLPLTNGWALAVASWHRYVQAMVDHTVSNRGDLLNVTGSQRQETQHVVKLMFL